MFTHPKEQSFITVVLRMKKLRMSKRSMQVDTNERGNRNEYSRECEDQGYYQSLDDFEINSPPSTYNPDMYEDYDTIGIKHWYLKNTGDDREETYADHIALLKTVLRCQKFIDKANAVMYPPYSPTNNSIVYAENCSGFENMSLDRKYKYLKAKPNDEDHWYDNPVDSFSLLKGVPGYQTFTISFEQDENEQEEEEQMSASSLRKSMRRAASAIPSDDNTEGCERYKQMFRFACLLKGNEGPREEPRETHHD